MIKFFLYLVFTLATPFVYFGNIFPALASAQNDILVIAAYIGIVIAVGGTILLAVQTIMAIPALNSYITKKIAEFKSKKS